MTVSNTDHPTINITGGPLQYTYRFTEIFLHWGSRDKAGSEHSINHHSFPAELQIFGYNSDLYPNIRNHIRQLFHFMENKYISMQNFTSVNELVSTRF